MTITLSHEKRRGQQIVSAVLHIIATTNGKPVSASQMNGAHRSITAKLPATPETMRGGCLIQFPEIPDNPPRPGVYIIAATLADGFTVWAKMEF